MVIRVTNKKKNLGTLRPVKISPVLIINNAQEHFKKVGRKKMWYPQACPLANLHESPRTLGELSKKTKQKCSGTKGSPLPLYSDSIALEQGE